MKIYIYPVFILGTKGFVMTKKKEYFMIKVGGWLCKVICGMGNFSLSVCHLIKIFRENLNDGIMQYFLSKRPSEIFKTISMGWSKKDLTPVH